MNPEMIREHTLPLLTFFLLLSLSFSCDTTSKQVEVEILNTQFNKDHYSVSALPYTDSDPMIFGGYFAEKIDFKDTTISGGEFNSYLAHWDDDAPQIIWAALGRTSIRYVVSASDNSLLYLGEYTDTTTFQNGYTTPTAKGVVLASIDKTGHTRWLHDYGNKSVHTRDLAIDPDGNVYHLFTANGEIEGQQGLLLNQFNSKGELITVAQVQSSFSAGRYPSLLGQLDIQEGNISIVGDEEKVFKINLYNKDGELLPKVPTYLANRYFFDNATKQYHWLGSFKRDEPMLIKVDTQGEVIQTQDIKRDPGYGKFNRKIFDYDEEYLLLWEQYIPREQKKAGSSYKEYDVYLYKVNKETYAKSLLTQTHFVNCKDDPEVQRVGKDLLFMVNYADSASIGGKMLPEFEDRFMRGWVVKGKWKLN